MVAKEALMAAALVVVFQCRSGLAQSVVRE
jgi:hypothetical protein